MKKILILILVTSNLFCKAQDNKNEKKSEKYIVTFEKNGKTINDTVEYKDTSLVNELQRMMTDPDYKPGTPKYDTVFNSHGKPILIKMSDDIFGASIQKFGYDSLNKLIKITGYDKQNKIKPFDKDIAIQLYKYDTKGNNIEIDNLGADGKFITSQYEDSPIIKMVYNSNNQLIEEWFLDENKNLKTEYGIIKYEYTKDDKKNIKGWFNSKGEKEK